MTGDIKMIIKSWLPEEDRNSHDHHSCTHSQPWATCNKREHGKNNTPPLNVGTHLHSIDAIRKPTNIKVSLPALSNRAYITLHRPAPRLVSMTALESSSKTWLSSPQSRLAIIMISVSTPLEGTEAGLSSGAMFQWKHRPTSQRVLKTYDSLNVSQLSQCQSTSHPGLVGCSRKRAGF